MSRSSPDKKRGQFVFTKAIIFIGRIGRSFISRITAAGKPRGFTLIELLIVVGIIALISLIVILVLNPAELIRQSQDVARVTDLKTLERGLQFAKSAAALSAETYDKDGPNFPIVPGSLTDSCEGETNQRIFVSVPSDNGETPPTAPSGWSWQRVSSTNSHKIDGNGWAPVNFGAYEGSGISAVIKSLPVDPVNTFSSGLYYTYTCGSFELNAALASKKYKDKMLTSDNGDDLNLFEVGSDLTISPSRPEESTSTPPTVSSIAPNSGANGGVVNITTVSGQNFQSGAEVKLAKSGKSDIYGVGFSFINDTTIVGGWFNLSGAVIGLWNVIVTNPDNQPGVLTSGFTVTSASTSAPTVFSILPSSSTNDGIVNITTVSGSDFQSGATVKLAKSGKSDIVGSGFSFVNSTTLNGGSFNLSGVATGTWNVVVQNTDNQSGTLANGFTVNPAGLDTTPPQPSPPNWSSPPTNTSVSTIAMTVASTTDATEPIQYLFVASSTGCGADFGTGTTSSSWLNTVSYTDSVLQTNRCYAYSVQARDSVASTPNTGLLSPTTSTYTSAAIPGVPTFGTATTSTIPITANAENGNPSSNPTTQFAVYVSSTDVAWNGKWVKSDGTANATESWMPDSTIDGTIVMTGLQNGTTYYLKVKARNENNEYTALGAAGSGATSASGPVADTILLWENPANIPAGWTCMSCSPGEDFYGVFPRASSSYGASASGSDTVSHTDTYVSAANGASNGKSYAAGSSFPPSTHTHTWTASFVTSANDIKPSYKDLIFIKANNPSQLPNGAIGIFEVASSSLPAGWSYYSALEGNYLRGGENDVSTGGSATHQHTITATLTSGGAASTLVAGASNPSTAHAANGHTHQLAVGSVATTATSSDPLFIGVVFGQLTATSSPPDGLVAIFNNAGSLPLGWSMVSGSASSYSDRLLKGAQTFGATGGRLTHEHDNTVITSSADTGGVSEKVGSGTSGASSGHTHAVTYSVDAQDSMPLNRYVILAKYSSGGGMAPSAGHFAVSPAGAKNSAPASASGLALVAEAFSGEFAPVAAAAAATVLAAVLVVRRGKKKKGG